VQVQRVILIILIILIILVILNLFQDYFRICLQLIPIFIGMTGPTLRTATVQDQRVILNLFQDLSANEIQTIIICYQNSIYICLRPDTAPRLQRPVPMSYREGVNGSEFKTLGKLHILCVSDAKPTTPRYRYRSNEGQTGAYRRKFSAMG
jgi:hypothetical protein